MRKMYVPARLEVDTNGGVTPLQIKAGYDGEWIDIVRVTNSGRRVSLAVGGVGIRYTCIIDFEGIQKEIYLFNEGTKWFVTAEDY